MKTKPLHHRVEVIYEDLDLIVISKASGVLSYPVPDRKTDSAIQLIRRYWKVSGIGHKNLYLLHRLDLDTSGLMVFAKTSLARKSLRTQFHHHTVVRGYLAVTTGVPAKKSGRLKTYLGRDARGRRAVMTKGKLAITDYKILKSKENSSLIACSLHTGRTHQVRIHLAHLGAPVAGDGVYGRSKGKLALFANMLGFYHPRSGSPIVFRLPLPSWMKQLIS